MKKVLIVDDEDEVRRFLQKNLCNDSLQVEIITTCSGEEALEVLKGAEQIDLVITEIKMPGISGFDLLFEIKNRYPYTSVIVMTALPTNENKREALLKGSLYFAEKPLDINKLRDVVSRALKEGGMFEGTVARIDLIDVIQMKTMSSVSGALRVKEGKRQGIIYFDEGKIIHAICDDLEGTEAFFRIMEFDSGILDDLKVTSLPEQTIDTHTDALLLEGVKHLDECKADDEDAQFGSLPNDSEDRRVVPERLKKVLIVDDEEDMLWSLQRSLCNESLNVEVLTASSGEEALRIMYDSEHIDLVITDIKMPGISGLDLLIEIKNRYPYTAVIVMTAFPSNEYKKEALLKGSLYFTEKPFDINELRKTIFNALSEDKMFKGTVAGVSLFDVIQIKFMSRISGALRVKEGKNQGVIYFDEGKIIHAICDDLEGKEAFFRTIEFNGGILEDLKVTNLPAQTIELPTETLLLEGAWHLDEIRTGNRAEEEEIPDDEEDNNQETVIQGDSSWQNLTLKEEKMAELKEVLREFTNVPGVNTACLVGRDGFLLDSIAMSGIDAEMIGAIASSGFGASESMGSQLGKGGLNLSMIEFEEGPVMLSPVGGDAFLVIVAEKDANLGMIRLKIKKYSAEIIETAGI